MVVCSSGIGSSKILGSLIRKNIPEIKNIEYSTPARLREDLAKDYDIVLSTIRLDEDINYILIPTILREEDTSRIKEKLLDVRTFRKVEYQGEDASKIGSHIDDILDHISSEEYNEKIKDLPEFLAGQLNLDKDSWLVKHLVERHEKSSILVPNTGVALFHTLDNTFEKPFIKIIHLNEELYMKNAVEEEERVKQVFVMVSPNVQAYTELLGQISIAILSDDIFKKVLDSRDI
ncbi:MAG: PTS sugar transporter subunit IIA, partial [Gemella sp.]|nr:PTS sugar transporter subunit IIA [Gemella sp.]